MDLMDYRRKIIANSPHLKSASGAVVTFSDGADLPLKSLLVNIDPVQSGTGDPSPSNIRPISGWNGVKVTRDGKNLLDPSKRVAYSSGKGQRWYEADGYTLIANQTYTFSVTYPNPISLHIRAKSDGTSLANGNNSVTYTPTANTDVYFQAYRAENISALDTFQLELGSTATTYEPYNGVNVSIDFGQTVYGGTLNPLTGVLTVDRIVEHPTSVTGSQINNYGRCYIYTTGSVALRKQTDALAMCDMLASTIATSATFAVNQYGGANAIYFISLDSTYDTVAKYNAWLAENKPTIVLWLADPIAIQLTPHQIRSLYGNNTIFADTGPVALEYWAHP